MKVLKPESSARFDAQEMEVYHVNGERWLKGGEIATALGINYNTLRGIYRDYKAEFTEQMTATATVATPGGPQQVRIFSRRGMAFIAMRANGPKAAQFRAWTLDVLEGKVPGMQLNASAALPLVALERKLSAANAELLRSNRTWNRIAGYLRMGLSHRDCAKLLDLDKSTIRVHVRRMEACGILTPPANLAALQGNVLNFRRTPELDGPHG